MSSFVLYVHFSVLCSTSVQFLSLIFRLSALKSFLPAMSDFDHTLFCSLTSQAATVWIPSVMFLTYPSVMG